MLKEIKGALLSNKIIELLEDGSTKSSVFVYTILMLLSTKKLDSNKLVVYYLFLGTELGTYPTRSELRNILKTIKEYI